MPEDSSRTFAALIRTARRDAGFTQEELAERAGISTRAVSDLERGVNHAPQQETLRLICDALDLSPEERLQWQALRKRISSRRDKQSPGSASRQSRAPVFLPSQLDSFIGRDREVSEIVGLLSQPQVRLVTLIGPGGVGKTRLALAICRQLDEQFSDGIHFVNLAPIRSPEHVSNTIASALGVTISGNEPAISVVIKSLRQSRCLLVLDNFEQVVAAAPLLVNLVTACPEVKLLATSRIPLRIQGEREYPVPPLEVPDQGGEYSVDELRCIEAVDLFVQRARAITVGFDLDEQNAQAVAGICRRLDGLPLAIELAAARTRILPPPALIKRLERRLPLLTATAHDLPERQRTLRNTIAWSYDLLTPEQQSLLRALSVFRGGWTLEAVDYMLDHADDGVGQLEALIINSLVQVHMLADGEARYSMLETIAEYVQDELVESGEAEHRRRLHADFFLALVEEAEQHFRCAEQEQWMNRLEGEHANIRATMRWSIARAQEGDRQAIAQGIRIAGAAWWFWYVQGHHREGRELLTPIVQMFRSELANDAAFPDVFPEVVPAYTRSVFGLVTLSYWLSDLEQFESMIQESRDIAQRFGKEQEVASSELLAAYLAGHVGKHADARVLFKRAVESSRKHGDVPGIAMALLGSGEMWLRQREYDLAADSLVESLSLFICTQDVRAIAAARATLGAVRVRQGRLEEGRDLLSASIRARFEIGDKGGIAWVLERLAELALIDPHSYDNPPMRAARLLSAAKRLREAIDSPVDPVDQPDIEWITSTAQAQLSDTAFVAAWEAGRGMLLERVNAYALDHDQSR